MRERAAQILGLGVWEEFLSLHRSPQETVVGMLGWEVTGLKFIFFSPFFVGEFNTESVSLAALFVAAVPVPREVLGHTEPCRDSALAMGCVPEENPLSPGCFLHVLYSRVGKAAQNMTWSTLGHTWPQHPGVLHHWDWFASSV